MDNFLYELENATTSKEWHFIHGTRPIVIVVDEANALKQMTNQAVSNSNLYQEIKTFLDFVVKVSKQTSKIHVILTSSDSFFEEYLIKGTRKNHF